METKPLSCLVLFGLLFSSLKVSTTEQAILVHETKSGAHSPVKKNQELIPQQRTGRSSQGNLARFNTMQNLEKQLDVQEMANLEDQRLISVKPLAKSRSISLEKQQHPIYVGSEYLLPYPRPGRYFTESMKESLKRQDSMIPHLRLGKSLSDVQQSDDSLMLPLARFGRSTDMNSDDIDLQGQFITPYPRLGKRDYYNSLPFYRYGRSSDFLTPYPRLGKRIHYNSQILPFHRLSRNGDYITPYPRLGKRDTSDSMLLPYPRLGRQDTSEGSEYMTPYPRLGKRSFTEDVMIPYPRLGKRYSEETILPYPRIGRAQNSNHVSSDNEESSLLYITPYPRLGKRSETTISRNMYAKILASLSDGTTDTLLPYMRPGRSDRDNGQGENSTTADSLFLDDDSDLVTMIPNFRFGRSENRKDSHNRKRRSLDFEEGDQVLFPFPRIGRRSDDSEYTRINPDTMQNERDSDDTRMNKNSIPSNSEDSPYMLPYLRPGRSNQRSHSNVLNLKHPKEKLISITHYNQDQDEDSSNDFYLLPYPRPGRSF